MPGHPVDLAVETLLKVVGPDPAPLVGAALADLRKRLGIFALPDGGGRQMLHLGPDLAVLATTSRPEPEDVAAAPTTVQALVQAAAGIADLLQWQAMLPPNAGFSTTYTPHVLDQARSAAAGLHQAAGSVSPALAAVVAVWWADVLRRGGQRDEALAYWEQLRAQAASTGEPDAAAYLDLVRGDWAAAPLSSPVVWNCALQPTVGTDGSLAGLELLEGWARADAAEAARWYDRAEPSLAEARRPDLALRRGWLAVVGGDTEAALRLVREAGRGYATQRHLRGGAAASTSLGLTLLAAGRLPADVATARQTGSWSQGPGGRATGVGLAQWCARVSRLWRLSGVMVEPALAALDLADALEAPAAISAPPDRAAEPTRHDVERAQVLASVGDTRVGRVLLEAALRRLPEVHSEAEATARQLESATYLMQLYQLATAARDGAGMRWAAQRFYDGGPAAPAAALGALLPQPEQDAIALVYDAQRLRAEGDEPAAAGLLNQAAATAQAHQPHAAVTVLVALHDYAAAADVVATGHEAAVAALDRGDLGVPVDMVPAELRAPMLALQRRRELFQSFSALTRLRDADRAEPLLAALRDAPDSARWWVDVADEREAHLLTGRLAELRGRLGEAAVAYEAGLAAVETRRAALSSDALKTAAAGEPVTADLYRGACRVALARGEPAQGLELAMRAQARGLVDLMAANTGDGTTKTAGDAPAVALPADLVAAWRGADAEQQRAGRQLLQAGSAGADEPTLARLRGQQRAAERKAAQAAERLAAVDPGFWRTVNPGAQPPTLTELRAALRPGQVLLQYVVDAGDVLAWAVTSDGAVAAHSAADVWEVPPAAARLRNACGLGGELGADATTLADRLLGPLASAIRGASRLLVVASGPLLGVPLHVLPFEGAPLGLGRVVTYLPSAAVLGLLSDAGAPALHPALIVGDPAGMALTDPVTGAVSPAVPLRGARIEAGYVASLLPGSTPLVGQAATEPAVRSELPAARVVHLATHGFLDADSPWDSCLLLADGAALSVAELAGLRLTADLVVLSACHSGGGEQAGGDELMGLARAVLAAGARRVVVTLWDVDDVSAALVMGRFYTGLVAGVDAPAALHDAQEWLAGLDEEASSAAYQALSTAVAGTDADLATAATRRLRPGAAPRTPVGYAHPRHWAPFVLIGT